MRRERVNRALGAGQKALALGAGLPTPPKRLTEGLQLSHGLLLPTHKEGRPSVVRFGGVGRPAPSVGRPAPSVGRPAPSAVLPFDRAEDHIV